MSLELIRGDYRRLLIDDLLDADGNPTVFVLTDVLRWTAKRRYGQADADALIAKSSTVSPGGITFVVGGNSGIVTILPADFADIALTEDLEFVWDLQLAPGGDVTRIVTLARGEDVIVPDVTLTVP